MWPFRTGACFTVSYIDWLRSSPISAPYDVKRYFISHEEAGQLCLLSCFLGENRDIYFPELDEQADLLTFSEIAVIVLAANGYVPDLCSSEDDAKEKAARLRTGDKTWPCYFFESDTTGEKPFEEFYTENDRVDFGRYRNIGIISQPPWQIGIASIRLWRPLRRSERWSDGEKRTWWKRYG